MRSQQVHSATVIWTKATSVFHCPVQIGRKWVEGVGLQVFAYSAFSSHSLVIHCSSRFRCTFVYLVHVIRHLAPFPLLSCHSMCTLRAFTFLFPFCFCVTCFPFMLFACLCIDGICFLCMFDMHSLCRSLRKAFSTKRTKYTCRPRDLFASFTGGELK